MASVSPPAARPQIPRALGCWMSWLIFGNCLFLYLAMFFFLTDVYPIANLFGGLGPNVASQALIAGIFCGVFFLLHLAALYSLDKRTSWAYPANLALMIIMLFIPPFGTGIAVWCLYELFAKREVTSYLRRDDLVTQAPASEGAAAHS